MSRFRRLSGDVPALFEACEARVIFLLYRSLLCTSLFVAGWVCGASCYGMMVNKAMWRPSVHADILEPQGPAVFFVEEGLAVGEAASDATGAFGIVGAVEEGDVLVADVTEPRQALASLATQRQKAGERGVGKRENVPVDLALVLE